MDRFDLSTKVIQTAAARGLTIGTAESCTGGLIAAALTDIAGSSAVVKGGVVSYAVSVKESVLGVLPETVENYGVVSEETAREMALGACRVLDCDLAVSTTGIAGPGGAEPGKPVGTVCFGLATASGCVSWTTCKGDSRKNVRDEAVLTALSKLVETLENM